MGFDLSKELEGAEESSFEPLPAGDYELQCVSAELKDTKNKAGQYISCSFNVVNHDKYTGRKVFTNFNINNPNEKAQQIGLGQLKSFIKSSNGKIEDVGKSVPESLVNLMAKASVKIKKDDKYGDKNEISYFKKGAASIPVSTSQNTNEIPF